VARDVVGALHSVTDRKAVKRVQLGGLVLILGVLQSLFVWLVAGAGLF
jgi:hypothetical protein